MKNNEPKEVSVRAVRNLVDYIENQIGTEFQISVYPQCASVNFDVEILDPHAWAEYLIENGAPDYQALTSLSDKGVVKITFDLCEWEGWTEDNIAEELQELYEWNEDGTISTPFVI